jgi:hypothetical protein
MTDIREFWETICSGYIRSLDQKVGKVTQATRLLSKLTERVKGAPSVEELASARPPGLINRCNLLIQGLGAEHRGEMREHQDVLRALVLLASNDFDIQDRGQQWLQGLPISEDETFRHGFTQSQKRPEQIVRGLSWLMSLVAPTVLALDHWMPSSQNTTSPVLSMLARSRPHASKPHSESFKGSPADCRHSVI